jgi:hypothetical protein
VAQASATSTAGAARPAYPASGGDRERGDDEGGREAEGDPHAGRSGGRRCGCDVSRARREREHGAHDRRAGDEPEVPRQTEHRGDDAPLARAHVRHHGRVVGGLEERVADGDDHDRADVAGDAERRGQRAQQRGTERHAAESDDGRAARAGAVGDAARGHAGHRGDERTDRQRESDQRRPEPERAREVERADDQRRHHHRRDERVRGEARAERPVAEHRQLDQRRRRLRLDAHEERGTDGGARQQGQIEGPEPAAAERHGERVRAQRDGEEQRAGAVEGGPSRRPRRAIRRQVPMRKQQREHA